MKKIKKVAVILISFIFFYGCAGWNFNGVDLNKIKNGTNKDKAIVVLGIGASGLIHTAGHIVCAKSMGQDVSINGLGEVYPDLTSNHKMRWIGRAGFISQLSVGYILNWIFEDNYFVDGYNIGTASQILSYPIRRAGDIQLINKGQGDGELELGIYSILSLLPFVEKK